MLTMMVRPNIFKHNSCRNCVYPKSGVHRYLVPECFVLWDEPMPHYSPPFHTSPEIHGKPWADIDINPDEEHPHWNQLDGEINRISHHGPYLILSDYPMNPIGRTGLWGRGVLGRWGPNHAIDAIVTRWKRTEDDEIVMDPITDKPVLQMIGMHRTDNSMWSIPSRIIDVGPSVVDSLKKRYLYGHRHTDKSITNDTDVENDIEPNKDDIETIEKFFSQSGEIYKGYVDDYRNTDNSWVETITKHYHDNTGAIAKRLSLEPDPDANEVKWLDISCAMVLNGNHCDIIEQVAARLDCHW